MSERKASIEATRTQHYYAAPQQLVRQASADVSCGTQASADVSCGLQAVAAFHSGFLRPNGASLRHRNQLPRVFGILPELPEFCPSLFKSDFLFFHDMMPGIDAALCTMLRSMQPVLHPDPYSITVQASAVPGAFATVAEPEGLTVIALLTLVPCATAWARISLSLHSDLSAVGLTAAFARALADEGISANVVAGFFHDHVFVPWEKRNEAVAALQTLSSNA
jgi:hypothetical protein